jgi:autotransporter-associated beta strand protein
VFGAAFASNNAQPEITANATVDQIEITDPGKDVVITIASNYTLNVDPHTEGSHLALDLGAAISNLTISGEGGFVQRGGTALNPLWDVTSTNGGDLIVDTDSFVISNGVALGIDIGAGRTVDLQTGADVSSASVSKSGDGLLILGGQNGWTGMTTIDGGTLQLADDNALSSASTVRFNDGSRLEVEGHDGGFGALDVNGTVVFDFANFGTSALSFGDSTGLSWGSAALVISNFTVGSDSIRFGTDAGGLTSGQLGDITLNGDANVLLDYNGYLVTGTEGNSTWTGDVDADWYTGSNWTAAVPPGENGVAAFFSSFALSNAQPTVTTSAAVDKIRVGNPAQDVVITVASGQILSVDHATDADLYAIDLDSASDDLTITGSGTFKQRGGTALTPVWNVTDSGDLTLETDGFSIEDGAALRITISSTRTVDLKSGAGSSSASVEKTGAGLLILSGQNGWTGDTSITAGTLQLGTNNALSANSAVSFSGGSMKTGGFDGDFGTLELTGSITFDFESAGTSDLAFANSTNLAWSGDLAIVNFSNEVDSIRFGTSSNGLTSAQLDGITVNGETNYVLDVDGYLVSGASPLDPIEDLEIGAAGGDVVLSWTGANGQSYDVESRTNLVEGAWQVYTNFIGDGGSISFTSAVGEATEFYRVKSE